MSSLNHLSLPVDLLWIQPAPTGSAARTHLDGTLTRLDTIGIKPRSVMFSPADERGGIVSKLRRMISLVTRANAVGRPGILIARWHPLLGLVTKRWRKRGGQVVLLVQGNDETHREVYPWFERIPGSQRLVSASLEEADSMLALNEGLIDWLRARTNFEARGRTIRFLPTGVNDKFGESRKSDDATASNYAIFFGNFAAWQGIPTILEALKSSEWPAEVRMIFVGSGKEAEKVRAATNHKIVYLGPLSVDELAPLVAGALCTLSPKDDTGSMALTTTPFKVLESVAAGVPVVASDIPGQRSLVEPGGYGILVPPSNPIELACSVGQIFRDEVLRNKLRSAAKRASPELRWQAAAHVLGAELEWLDTRSGAEKLG